MDLHNIFELRTYRVPPGKLEPFVALATGPAATAAKKHADLVGQWTTEIRELAQVVELWRFLDFRHRAAARANVKREPGWQAFMTEAVPMLERMEALILLESEAWPFSPPQGSPIYELRDYRLHPGKTAAWLECWARGMTVRRHFSKPIGIWYSELGALNRIVHLWAYDDLQHRHEVRRTALGEPLWRDTVATLATMMQRMETTILVPTPASGLK